jgi:hypothetical protein
VSSLLRCPRCGEPLKSYYGDRYCPNCVSYRPARLTFDQWMEQVDAALVRKVGVCSADLPDFCYADMYEAGYSPETAADEAIEAA